MISSIATSCLILSVVTLSKVIADSTISTCHDQNPCIKFISKQVILPSYSRAGWEVCAVVDFKSPQCSKISTENIGYTCLKNLNTTDFHNVITGNDSSGFSPLVKMVPKVKDGYTQCQIVPAGADAQFLFFDGNSCKHVSDETRYANDTDNLSLTCSARNKDTLGCGKNKQNVECVWTVTPVVYNDQSVARMDFSQYKEERQLQAAPTRAPVVPTTLPTAKPVVPTKLPTAKPVVPTKPPTPKPTIDKCPFKWYFVDARLDRVLTPEIVNGKTYSRIVLAQQLSLLVQINGAARMKFNFGTGGEITDRIVPFTLGGDTLRVGGGALVRFDFFPSLYLSYPGLKKIKVSAYRTLTGRVPYCTETLKFRLTF